MQHMKTLQVVSQTDKVPFAGCCGQAAQQKLAESHHFLDVAKDRLNRALAQSVNNFPCLDAQLVEHLGFVISIV